MNSPISMSVPQAMRASSMFGSLCRVIERGMYVTPARKECEKSKRGVGNGSCGPDKRETEDMSFFVCRTEACVPKGSVNGGVTGVCGNVTVCNA